MLIRAILVLFLCIESADAASMQASRPILSLKEIRRESVVMQQWDVSCGPAALATILTYHRGDPISEKLIVERLLGQTSASRVKSRGGFSLLELKRFAEERGYKADGYGNLKLADLERLAPLIVPINTAGYNHFVVFNGTRGDRVLLADPAFGNHTMTAARFERVWVDNLGFTVEKSAGAGQPMANAGALTSNTAP